MERDYLKKYSIEIVILSRGRSGSMTTTRIVPDWVPIVVPESEKSAYEAICTNPLIFIPDEVKGLGNVRNWCLKRFNSETLIMMDDDLKCCYCLTHEKTQRIDDKDEVVQILINTAIMAKDAGAHVFGFAQTDIRKYNGTDPFDFCTWVGGVIGVVGRKYTFRDDYFKVDIDYCLQNLLVDRIIWQDDRYWFSQARDNNVGGNSAFRTEERFEWSVQSLKDKWGDCIKVRKHKNQYKITLNVKRKQVIEYE